MANAVAARRRLLDLSQEMLAEQAGISRPYLSQIERGEVNPSINIALALAKALKCRPDELFFGHDVNHNAQLPEQPSDSAPSLPHPSDRKRGASE